MDLARGSRDREVSVQLASWSNWISAKGSDGMLALECASDSLVGERQTSLQFTARNEKARYLDIPDAWWKDSGVDCPDISTSVAELLLDKNCMLQSNSLLTLSSNALRATRNRSCPLMNTKSRSTNNWRRSGRQDTSDCWWRLSEESASPQISLIGRI